MYAQIENNQVIQWPIASLVPMFPHTSFPSPLTDSDMPDGYVVVGVIAPPTPGPDQKVVPGLPVQQGGKWVQGWDVVPMTPEEITEQNEAKAADVRAERNRKLAECDWTQLPDAPVDAQAWAAYRQDLRNVTGQPGFPFDVQWPNQPS